MRVIDAVCNLWTPEVVASRAAVWDRLQPFYASRAVMGDGGEGLPADMMAPMFSARQRRRLDGEPKVPVPLTEEELYAGQG